MGADAAAGRWLQLDAVYCAASGLLALALAAPIGRLFDVPVLVPAATGAATIAWAGLLMLVARGDGRRWLAVVVVANAAAMAAIMIVATFAPTVAGRLLLVAVAIEVGAIGAFQLAALRRPAR
jgi:hypothetical protein